MILTVYNLIIIRSLQEKPFYSQVSPSLELQTSKLFSLLFSVSIIANVLRSYVCMHVCILFLVYSEGYFIETVLLITNYFINCFISV